MRWRIHTAFGNERSLPTPDELEAYLRWAARMRAMGETDFGASD
jgi:hypothetical protein